MSNQHSSKTFSRINQNKPELKIINNYNRNLLFQKPKRLQIISSLIFFTFMCMHDLIYTSTEINNTSILSDIYMENIISKSQKDLDSKENQRPPSIKLKRITFEEISNYEKSKKDREEALMNYYSEYISLIKEIVDDTDNIEEKAFEDGIKRNNNELNELIETPLQMTKDELKCIIFGNGCGYEIEITEDGKTVFKNKKGLENKAAEISNDHVNYNRNINNIYNSLSTDSERRAKTNANKQVPKNEPSKSAAASSSNNNDKNTHYKSSQNEKQTSSTGKKQEKDFSYSNQNNNNNNNNNNNDLYDEVVSEILKDDLNSKKIFELSLKFLYSNSTLFHFTIEDLENLIKFSYITDGQAVLLWETLTMQKTDRLKNLNLQRAAEHDAELYLFNLIPTKSIALFVLNSGMFVIGYNMLLSFNSKDRDKASYLVNIIMISFSLYTAENFYAWKYYLVCCQMLILFIFALKCFMDSLYLRIGFALEDYSFFGSHAKTKNATQFVLKIIVLCVCTMAIGVFTFSKFAHFYNYILFYICITQILNLISVFFQYEVATIFQPFRHFVMIAFGFLNFLVLNFHKKNYFFSEYNSHKKLDSFYLIGDSFTFFCFFFLYDYLFTQSNNISNLFYEKNLDNEKINSQISSIMKDHSEMNRSFTSEDSLWILGFFVGLLFQYVGLKSNKYLVFYFSFYYFKTVFSIFGRLFHVRYLRFIYNVCLFLFLITNHIITSRNDEILFEILNITNTQVISIAKFILRMIGIIYIFIIIFQNHEYITTTKYNENMAFPSPEELTPEQLDQIYRKEHVFFDAKKNKKVKTIQISLVKEMKQKCSFRNIVHIQIDIYGNYLMISLLLFLIKELEMNFAVLLAYYLLIILLMTKMLFFINDFKNDTEYLYAYSIAFFVGIRLITHTMSLKTSFVLSCIYMFNLIVMYCLNSRRRNFFSILIIFHLYSACVFLNSNFVFILIIVLISVPLFLIKGENNKLNCSVMSIFFPMLLTIVVQIYGFRNVLKHLLTFNSFVKQKISFDLFGFAQNIVHGEYINEQEIIAYIVNFFNTNI